MSSYHYKQWMFCLTITFAVIGLSGISLAGTCPNGIIDPGEECDDGNKSNSDECLNTCVLAKCGDGVLHFSVEKCDDGNVSSGDGCSSTCQIEPPLPGCGNGVQEKTEECDDGNENQHDSCLNNCVEARCGDGFVRDGVEACDDGNILDGDGCSRICGIESEYICFGEPSQCVSVFASEISKR